MTGSRPRDAKPLLWRGAGPQGPLPGRCMLFAARDDTPHPSPVNAVRMRSPGRPEASGRGAELGSPSGSPSPQAPRGRRGRDEADSWPLTSGVGPVRGDSAVGAPHGGAGAEL